MDADEAAAAGNFRRRDYERNREAILEAANECFVELGTKAPINSIAERAGVGAATVYRHFPTRGELERAVLDVRISVYAGTIETAQSSGDGREAFRRTVHGIVKLQARDRAFRELMASDVERFAESPGVQRFATALLGAFARASSEGVTRADVTSEDIMLLLIATEGVARRVPEDSAAALERIVDLILDGLCGETSELTGAALGVHQLVDVARD